MALTDDEQAALRRMKTRLDRDLRPVRTDGVVDVPGFEALRGYYRGIQRLQQLGLAVPDDLRRFVTIVAWPRTYVDAIVSRLRPQGFLLDGVSDEKLWNAWQANNMDAQIRMALTDMIAYKRGYLSMGTADDGGVPLMRAESPFQMIHEWSPRDNKVTHAARFYVDESEKKKVTRSTLYTPDSTVWLHRERQGWVEDEDHPRDDHNLGRVLVEPLVNRPSTDEPYGESEMVPVITLTDAAARALTNAQVATEVMALPQRWAAGMTQADFKDPETGKAVTAWEAYFGAVWATGNKDARFGQFTAADLQNFKTIVDHYATLVAGVTGLPMRYFGQNTANPPSAEGIRADEARLVGTAEEKQEYASDGIENGMRTLAALMDDSPDPEKMALLQTDWRDAATPTVAQATDAAVKMHAEELISRREALRMTGRPATLIDQIEREIAAEQTDSIARLIKANADTQPADNGPAPVDGSPVGG